MSSTDLMNIEAFRGNAPAQAFQSVPMGNSLAEGIGSSYGIIGYRGKVWSLRYRGESYTFTRSDDGSPLAFLDCIIVRAADVKSKSYYPAGTFDQNSSGGERPRCASIDGVTPDDDSLEKQAVACAVCPRNEFKVNAEGRKTRECGDYKRLAVLVLPSLTGPLLGAPLEDPVFLRVPAASLNDLAVFGEAMQKQGYPYFSFVTRIGFMPDKAHPQMTFRALQPLTDNEAPYVMERRESDMAKRITGEDQIAAKAQRPITAPVNTGFIQQAQPQVQPQVQPVVQQAVQPTVTQAQPVVQTPIQQQVQPVQQQVVQQAPQQVQQPVNTGLGLGQPHTQPVQQAPMSSPLGGLGVAQAPIQQPQPQVQQAQPVQQATVHAEPMANPSVMGGNGTISDMGSSDADADLDAKIAGILKTPS